MRSIDDSAGRALRDQLTAVLGAEQVIAERDRLLGYERDWTGQWQGTALMAARPETAEQVAAVLRICVGAGVGVVVQGGNTGLVGGSVPLDGELVLDTTRFDVVGPVDPYSRQATYGAGVTLEAAQLHAREAGLDLAVDLAARGQATLGGMVATNAGGAMALRYGTMRASVTGLEAVLADGTIVRRLSGVPKDNAGFDLPALLIGSEGTLGVITAVRLALTERHPERVVGLVGVADLSEAVELVRRLRDAVGPALEAAECFDRPALELVCEHRALADPLPRPAPIYVLVQLAAPEPTELLAAGVEERYLDAMAVAEGSDRQEALWAYREGLNEAAGAVGIARKYDVSVPIGEIAAFAEQVDDLVAKLDGGPRLSVYGHLGDGNLHLNVLGTSTDPELARLDSAVSATVAGVGGTISAEHGIGRAKREMLEPTRSAAEVRAMRAIKQALDPAGTLGAGRVLSPLP